MSSVIWLQRRTNFLTEYLVVNKPCRLLWHTRTRPVPLASTPLRVSGGRCGVLKTAPRAATQPLTFGGKKLEEKRKPQNRNLDGQVEGASSAAAPGSRKRRSLTHAHPTCSAQVTPAMPPPTTTNFPAVAGGRAASMLSDFQEDADYSGATTEFAFNPEEKSRRTATSGTWPCEPGVRVPSSSDLVPSPVGCGRCLSDARAWCDSCYTRV